MLVKKAQEIKLQPVQDQGAIKARMAVLIGPEEGAPNFIMRQIELEAGGCTPHHSHPWEHIVYVLAGAGLLIGEQGTLQLKPGSSVLVQPDEVHQFTAGKESPLVFLCSIPKR